MAHTQEVKAPVKAVFGVAVACALASLLGSAIVTLVGFVARNGIANVGLMDLPLWFLRLGVPSGFETAPFGFVVGLVCGAFLRYRKLPTTTARVVTYGFFALAVVVVFPFYDRWATHGTGLVSLGPKEVLLYGACIAAACLSVLVIAMRRHGGHNGRLAHPFE
jgi:hypothetical protein